MPYVGCIRYVDFDECDREFSYIRDVSDLAKLEAFVNNVAPLLGAVATKVAVTETKFVEIFGAANSIEIDQHVQINLRDEDGTRRGFMLPAPSLDLFETINGVARLKKTYGDQLAAFYATLTGINVVFTSGAKVGPQPTN